MSLGEYLGSGASVTKLLLHLNGNSTDSSGNSNSGTDTNITYSLANGKFGQGAGFNGSSSRIDGSLAQPTSAYTISMWVNSNLPQTDSNVRLFDTQNTPNTSTGVILAYNTYLSNSTRNLRIYHNNGNWISSNDLGNLLQDSKYHLITASWNGTVMFFYVDGNYVGGGNYNTAITNGGNYTIGAGRVSTTWFNGKIDEVIVENTAWSAEKIKKYYTFTKARFGIL